MRMVSSAWIILISCYYSLFGAVQTQFNNYEDYRDTYYYNPDLFPKRAPTPLIQCYSCHYNSRQNDVSGVPGCSEDFDAASVAVVECPANSSSCGTLFINKPLSEEYFITRSCYLDCVSTSLDESGSYMTCCAGDLCNDRVDMNSADTSSAASLGKHCGIHCVLGVVTWSVHALWSFIGHLTKLS